MSLSVNCFLPKTYSYFSSSLERTKGGGEIKGAGEELKKEGRRWPHCSLPVLAQPLLLSHVACLSSRKVGQTHKLSRDLARETNCRWQEDTANARRQRGPDLTQPPCPRPDVPLAGSPPAPLWALNWFRRCQRPGRFRLPVPGLQLRGRYKAVNLSVGPPVLHFPS